MSRGFRDYLFCSVAIATFFACTASFAEGGPEDRACILRAAEYLPRIPGIEIKASRTSRFPAEIEAQLDKTMFHAAVEIDAKTAGQEATYRFICTIGPGVAPIVQRMQ